jgi:hypothetical protein
MAWQWLLTVLLVAGCSAYALWSLMPAALRKRLRAVAGIKPVADAGGCGGCGSCSDTPVKPGAPQVVHIVRRPPAS